MLTLKIKLFFLLQEVKIPSGRNVCCEFCLSHWSKGCLWLYMFYLCAFNCALWKLFKTHIHTEEKKKKEKKHSRSDQSLALNLLNKRIMCPGRGTGDTRRERHSNYHLNKLRNGSPEIWESSPEHFLPSLTSAHWISLLTTSTPLNSLMSLFCLWYSHFSQREDTGQTELPSVPHSISYMFSLSGSVSPQLIICLH